jgi:hypothetical protein
MNASNNRFAEIICRGYSTLGSRYSLAVGGNRYVFITNNANY